MRKRRAIIFAIILLTCLGITAIIMGLFAYQLGFARTNIFSYKRRIVFTFGVTLLLAFPVIFLIRKIWKRIDLSRKFRKLKSRLAQSKLIIICSHFEQNYQNNRFNQFFRSHSWIWAIIGSGIAVLISFWYLTSGTFKIITPYLSYYDRQANAFLAGKLSLLEEPPKELAQLSNPYDMKNRVGINYLWDVSYFHGKYYLYWGPFPAVIAAGIKLIYSGVVEDQVLVFLFIVGLAVTFSTFLYWMRKTFFASTPGWTIFLFTLTGILCTPVLWLICRPKVYEAAIASAQFFLVLGLYGAIRGVFSPNKKQGWLVLSGFCLGAAVGSRSSYVFAVIFFSIVICVAFLKGLKSQSSKIHQILYFLVPLAIIGAGLAWFNYARFGNIFETGNRYQLTGLATPTDYEKVFSLNYIVPNLYSSLFRPFTFTPAKFPFFVAPWIGKDMWPRFIHIPPNYYYSEPVSGVLLTIPLLWMLVIIPLVKCGRKILNWINGVPQTPGSTPPKRSLFWLLVLFSGGTFCLYFTLMCFVYSTMRYLADFTPMLILLTVTVVWKVYEGLASRPERRKVLLFAMMILCIMTITVSLLMNMQNGLNRFQTDNPVLYEKIANFFIN